MFGNFIVKLNKKKCGIYAFDPETEPIRGLFCVSFYRPAGTTSRNLCISIFFVIRKTESLKPVALWVFQSLLKR